MTPSDLDAYVLKLLKNCLQVLDSDLDIQPRSAIHFSLRHAVAQLEVKP